ncbi:MAG: AarF/UbiB family protein [Nocardioides sp.]
MTSVLVVAGFLLNAGIVAFVVRRLLGVPVGWPRTIILSLLVGASPLVDWVIDFIELDTEPTTADGRTALFLVFTLLLAWLLAFEIAVLSILEALFPTGSLPHPVAFVRSLPARGRRSRRYAAIVRIAGRHGLVAYLRPFRSEPDQPSPTVARSLRVALAEGGVTFIKLGQMLSTRADVLPTAYVRELSTLQSDVPPEPWAAVVPVIESELGRPVEELFASVDQLPLAAASTAQVHAARLHDGTEVVIKVQRPGARRQAAADLDIVLRLAAWLNRSTSWGRRLGVLDLARGFAVSLEEELDYRVEHTNMRAIATTLESDGPVHVPRVWPELSRSRVLVVQRMTGRPVSQSLTELAAYDDEQRRTMAESLLGCVLRQVVVDGVFHADLHPGNIFLDDDGRFCLLDFGSVGRLDQATRASLGSLLMAVDRQDSIAATDALIDLLDRPEDLDDRRLEREVGQLVMRVSDGGSATMFIALFRIVLDHGFSVPPPIAAAFRTLGALEGTLQIVSPGLDLGTAARAQGRALVGDRMTPEAVRAQLEAQLATLVPMLQRLPRRIDRIADQLEGGRLTVRLSFFGDRREQSFVTGLVQQAVVAGLAAALALCGVILIVADDGPLMTAGLRAYTFVGFTLLLFGFVLGARALALTFASSTSGGRGSTDGPGAQR